MKILTFASVNFNVDGDIYYIYTIYNDTDKLT